MAQPPSPSSCGRLIHTRSVGRTTTASSSTRTLNLNGMPSRQPIVSSPKSRNSMSLTTPPLACNTSDNGLSFAAPCRGMGPGHCQMGLRSPGFAVTPLTSELAPARRVVSSLPPISEHVTAKNHDPFVSFRTVYTNNPPAGSRRCPPAWMRNPVGLPGATLANDDGSSHQSRALWRSMWWPTRFAFATSATGLSDT